ncbi:uncharacterized protein N7529_007983 [Penicillium soppii]|uniref:uncharacterized protein n=1 Tax=Penicillium soppii TaxID=69789 RepID=UPI00254929B5|nr:uncharacterized protein N7529_007983 [Penicillium soppii]KAJ5860673.1 hypothetical protein N7529_007983 [Penicillium soppii]
MPGLSPEDSITWKKRKREDELAPRPTYIPSFRVEEYNCPLSNEPNFRPRCLPRKRRHVNVQSPYLLQHQPQHQPQSHLAPIYQTTDSYSPPISPKTLVPLHYPQSASPSALRPCHICHRRPTTRQVLDAYADCDLCHERACFICLRQCDSASCGGSLSALGTLDPEPHEDLHPNSTADRVAPRKICSGCAVEDVTESGAEIVRCLDCVRGWEIPNGWALDDMHMHQD